VAFSKQAWCWIPAIYGPKRITPSPPKRPLVAAEVLVDKDCVLLRVVVALAPAAEMLGVNVLQVCVYDRLAKALVAAPDAAGTAPATQAPLVASDKRMSITAKFWVLA